ncbi:DUF6641 family protein [Catenovulum adriaticum]|uniref:Uncharacterized protein n=1 Tax=Catenovulum adriaticum TaxID=2984846 RepID=A0ABY7ALK0_9ALTE|nr:DUF6641 family protein [Catenovulum sp. TS8]WAJ69541.1 hypothetical protein OLW01_10200 [Catenovulum sp. TS8]
MTTSILSSLKVTARPKNPKTDLVMQRRERLLTKLNQQLDMAVAFINNEEYTVYKEKWRKDPETGLSEKIRIPKRISPWFFQNNNTYYFQIRLANKPIEITKGCSAFEVGEKESLPAVIGKLIKATVAGELDSLLSNQLSIQRPKTK